MGQTSSCLGGSQPQRRTEEVTGVKQQEPEYQKVQVVLSLLPLKALPGLFLSDRYTGSRHESHLSWACPQRSTLQRTFSA